MGFMAQTSGGSTHLKRCVKWKSALNVVNKMNGIIHF